MASQDLYTMGIMVVSYTIKDVSDEVRNNNVDLEHIGDLASGGLPCQSWASKDCRSEEGRHHRFDFSFLFLSVLLLLMIISSITR